MLREEYIEFFDLLGKHSQLSIKMLVPNKYEKLDTEVFACLCYQQMLLKKVVIDNMKECADKYANNILKTSQNVDKKVIEFSEMELDSDMEDLIENYLYFKNRHKRLINTSALTAYISYLLVTTPEYKSYLFFKNCLYAKADESVKTELLNNITECIDAILPTELLKYGKFLISPLKLRKYACYGRDIEIKKSIDTLCRMKKSNVLLVGNAGVGKTSIVYGICNYLQSDKCIDSLQNLYVYELNINRLVSGTTYRGDLEQRLENIIGLLQSTTNIIVFIDEIHMLFNKTGGENESSVIQNVLKPFLAENSKMIGCTTNDEYKIIESDKAFERRFTTITVEEMSKDATYNTLKSAKNKYSEHYNIEISYDMCDYITDVCAVYIKNRYFPDKAFDVLDKACVNCIQDERRFITQKDIDKSVYDICNINPTTRNLNDLRKIENSIKESIFGQDAAIESVLSSIRRYYVGTNDKTKPIGSFMFVGSTGVGKTELCKQIAKNCFSEESFIRYDMSEFIDSNTASKLIGAPAGYVGYSSGGSLTEKVKHLPFAIILFDEIEKAHQDVINILLQIMDDGRLTDSFGTTVDFCNCLIIMTSNIGCSNKDSKRSIGFSETDKVKSDITDSINQYFSPEFRNRLDDIIIFNNLSEESYKKIFEKQLSMFIDRYDSIGVSIEISSKARKQLYQLCYSEKDGVRYIAKTISKTIENIVLDQIENGQNKIKVDFGRNKFLAAVMKSEKSCS